MQKKPTTWQDVKGRYPIGAKVSGIVHRVWKFGARIELETGLLGRLRNREISWEKEVQDAQKELKVGQPIEVSVLQHDDKHEDLIVSIRRAIYDPWKVHRHKYVPNKIFRGQIAQLTGTGAVVEFEDRMTAWLPRDDIVPWSIRHPDRILDVEDWVEVVVVGHDDAKRRVIGSMHRRLERLGKELAEMASVARVESFEDMDRTGAEGPDYQIVDVVTADGVEHSMRILVEDDEEDERLQMQADLEELGYEESSLACSVEETRSLVATVGFDLVLLDVRLGNKPHNGLRLAEEIKRLHPSLPIILMTGFDWVESCRKGQELELAGMLKKPVSLRNLARSLRDIEQRGHTSWPQIPFENEETRRIIANLSAIADLSVERRPLQEVLVGILDKLQMATGADGSAVFALDPQTSAAQSVELLAFRGLKERRFRRWRNHMWKSPVKDVIYDGEHIFENRVFSYEGKFRYLRKIRGFDSCIGVPVSLSGRSELGYGLFLFHTLAEKFTEGHLMLAEATSLVIGTAVREHHLIQELADKQKLTIMGGLLTSIGHEILAGVSMLRTSDRVQDAWQRVESDPSLLNDEAFVNKTDRQIQRMVAAKNRIVDVVDTLLAPSTQTFEGPVDVAHCLRTALSAIGKQAQEAQIIITCPDPALPQAYGSRTALIQVFLNILNNAVQQMEFARRSHGRIIIETRYEPHASRPIQIRFRDTGPGVHTKHWRKIFEPMFTTKPFGIGMGLFICEGLLASMGGLISLEESTIMVGTTFLVELRAVGTRRRIA